MFRPSRRGAGRSLCAAALITALNIVRLGNLSLIAENQALLDLLHIYIWPVILILASAGFVYAWMGRHGFGAAGLPGSAPAQRVAPCMMRT